MLWRRAAVAAILGAAAAAAGASGDERDVTVVNRTGEAIHGLFISPVDADAWEEDVRGADVLADGESVDVSFSGYDKGQCAFDILATNREGDRWVLPAVDLCRATTVTITARYVRAE